MFCSHEKQLMDIIQQLVKNNSHLTIIIDKLLPIEQRAKLHSLFTFEFLNYKFTSTMDAVLTVPSGTPVSGFNAAGDAKGNNLGDSAYKAGSCVYAVIVGPSGNPPGFTVAPGAREEAFIVTETGPTGTASDGIITFDAQDVNGNPIPQSKGTLTFTVAPLVATQNLFNFDQTSH